MLNVYQILFFAWIKCKYANPLLNKTEEKITTALMKELQIDHRILIEEPSSDLIIVDSFKNFESWTMIVNYRNLEELYKFFVRGYFPDPQTMIVLKVRKLSIIADFLNNVTLIGKSHIMRKFTWLIIADWFESKLEDQRKLLVPYNCEFFILHPISLTKFKLVEVYKIKNENITFEYGTWDEDFGLITTELSWYSRRENLKNITLVMMGLTIHGEVGTCSTDRQCSHVEFIECLAVMMNFNIKWIKKPTTKEFYTSVKEMDLTDLHTTLTLLHIFKMTGELEGLDLTSPVFTNKYTTLTPRTDNSDGKFRLISSINWYIKDPGSKKRSDFYFKPFEADIWVSIMITIFVGSLTLLTVDYFLRKLTNSNSMFQPSDDVFMPLECLCSQDGGGRRSESSLRLISFALRFLTIFILGTYLGNITSFLTVRIPQIPFRNLKEFLENEQYFLGADSYEIHKLFRYSQDPIINQIKKENRFLTVPNESKYTVNFYTEAHKKVCSEKLIYVEYNDEAYSYGMPCKVYEIDPPITAIGMSAVIPENSPFKEMINLNIIRFQTSGIRHRTQKNILKHRIFKEDQPAFNTVEFEQIVQVLGFLSIGMMISISIFIFELILKSKMTVKYIL